MPHRTEDLRIQQVRPLIPPAVLHEEVPATDAALATVVAGRQAVVDSLTGKSDRLVCVVGPCSIHDAEAAVEYASKLVEIAKRHEGELAVLMRTYFEKPRTSVGWKGLINDPDLDDSFHVNKGLRIARKLLLEINELGMPVGCEFLDTTVPQHIADLVAWGAIGARTTESQIHRQLASGLSMPVGFKNATDGEVQPAVDALKTAAQAHWFPSVTKQGVAALSQTTGNEDCHIILRGGYISGPNYDAAHVTRAADMLEKCGMRRRVMVDCSHGNSEKDCTKQSLVARSLAEQISGGSHDVFGVMVESNLVAGRQDYVAGEATYGQSITDSCIDVAKTGRVLAALAAAVAQRRG